MANPAELEAFHQVDNGTERKLMLAILACRAKEAVGTPVIPRCREEILIALDRATAGGNIVLKFREGVGNLQIHVSGAAEWALNI